MLKSYASIYDLALPPTRDNGLTTFHSKVRSPDGYKSMKKRYHLDAGPVGLLLSPQKY